MKEVIYVEGLKSDRLSPGWRTENFVYTSGQIGVDPKTGKLAKTIQEQAKQALENIRTILKNAGATVNDVIKVTIFLSDIDDYANFNKVYVTFFKDPKPARTCVKADLARPNAKVEIEAIAYTS